MAPSFDTKVQTAVVWGGPNDSFELTPQSLLAQRYPAFVHPTRSDLSDEVTPEVVIRQYADLLQNYAIDIVRGDFSPFPNLMYVLHHVDRKFPTRAVRRFLGVYSTYAGATAAIEDRSTKRGYSDRRDGFEIWRVEPDGQGFWFAGIPLDEPRDVRQLVAIDSN